MVSRGYAAEERGRLRVTAGGHEVSFWGDKNVLGFDRDGGLVTLNILKTAELYVIKLVNFIALDFQNKKNLP